jgi:type I restriction enzyme S subunit
MAGSKTAHWKEVPFSNILTYIEEPVVFDEMAQYTTITVKRRHGGLEAREKLFGHEIKTKKQFRLHPGAFILSRVQCWHAAFAIVPSTIPENMIASQNYDQFTISPAINERFFWWFSHSPQFIQSVRDSTSGVVIEKVVFNRAAWLQKTISLPSLEEQHHIVKHIESVATRVETALSLRNDINDEANKLFLAQSYIVFSKIKEKFESKSFGSFSPHVTSGPRYWRDRYSDSGKRFYRAQDIGKQGNILHTTKAYVNPPDSNQGKSALLENGDLMIVITGATVGRCAIYSDDLEPGYVSQHVSICRLPQDKILPRYALLWLISPDGQQQLLGQIYGQGKPGLNLTNIRSIVIPIPPLDEQQRIVAYLDGLQAKVDELRRLQSESERELSALMPSILDRAFKGEL